MMRALLTLIVWLLALGSMIVFSLAALLAAIYDPSVHYWMGYDVVVVAALAFGLPPALLAIWLERLRRRRVA